MGRNIGFLILGVLLVVLVLGVADLVTDDENNSINNSNNLESDKELINQTHQNQVSENAGGGSARAPGTG